jgi:hypothetical protein
MTFLPSNFPRRVRIHGGGFDASARAMHREAAFENVSIATIERKIMSTKTTLKRVALVAVAAMGLGLLSVVPSSATTQSDTLSLSAATSSVTVGTAASTTLTQTFIGSGVSSDTMTVTVSLSSSPSGNSVLPTITAVVPSSVNGATSATGLVGTLSDTSSVTSQATGVYTLGLSGSAIAGTYVIKVSPANVPTTIAAQAAAITWTVTVGAEGPATAAQSTWGMAAGTGAVTQGTHTAITAAITTNTQVATIQVVPLKADSTTPAAIKLTATITSGPGTLAFGRVLQSELQLVARLLERSVPTSSA